MFFAGFGDSFCSVFWSFFYSGTLTSFSFSNAPVARTEISSTGLTVIIEDFHHFSMFGDPVVLMLHLEVVLGINLIPFVLILLLFVAKWFPYPETKGKSFLTYLLRGRREGGGGIGVYLWLYKRASVLDFLPSPFTYAYCVASHLFFVLIVCLFFVCLLLLFFRVENKNKEI